MPMFPSYRKQSIDFYMRATLAFNGLNWFTVTDGEMEKIFFL